MGRLTTISAADTPGINDANAAELSGERLANTSSTSDPSFGTVTSNFTTVLTVGGEGSLIIDASRTRDDREPAAFTSVATLVRKPELLIEL